MNRTAILGIGAGIAMSLSAFGAQAMPVAGSLSGASPLVEQVIYGDGCGPRGVRGPRGFCRPIGGPRFGYGPPPPRFYYGPPRPRHWRRGGW